MIRQVLQAGSLMALADGTFTLVSGLLLVPLYTHSMSADEYGVVVVVRAIAVVVVPLLFFFGTAYMRYYYDHAEGDRGRFSGTLFVLVLLTGATCWAVSALVGPWVHNAFLSKVALSAFYWALAIATIEALRSFADISLRLRYRFTVLCLASLGQTLLLAALSVWLVRELRLGFMGWVLATAGAGLAVSGILWGFAARGVRPSWSSGEVKRVLRFSWPLLIFQFAWFVSNRSDVIILQHYRTLAESAVYSVAYTLGMVLMMAVGPLDKIMGPLFYRDISTPDGPRQWCRLTTLVVGLLVWLALAVSSLAPALYGPLFPATYAAGVAYVAPVAWAFVFKSSDVFIGRALMYCENTVTPMVLQVCAAALNLGLNLLLVPRYGAPAAAYVTLTSFTLYSTAVVVFSQRAMPLPYEWGRLAVLLVLGVGLTIGCGMLHAASAPAVAWSLRGGALAAQAVAVLIVARVPVLSLARGAWWRLQPARHRAGGD
ncbi:MAG: lipopolysaccharide biosynthesis protein [Armatimonadetes bacterium]|nr:lipopolysaccharide biosynthesis protein [Armatimonadota bacterium]